jgi:hypothetical protein
MNAATIAVLFSTARPSFVLPRQVATPQYSASSKPARLSTCTSRFDVLQESTIELTGGKLQARGGRHASHGVSPHRHSLKCHTGRYL